MGKKVNHQLSSTRRTSKNVDKQLHSVIKVLRPKVYITQSSSFKHLVQELTGYRTQTVPNPDDVAKAVSIIGTEDQGEILFPDFTTTLPTNSSFGCSVDLSDDQAFRFDDMNQVTGPLQPDNGDMFNEMYNLTMNYQQTDLLECQNLESWLLDADPYDSNRYEQEEVSLFDYELLSGLI